MYAEYESIKLKLRIPDDSMKEEVNIYIQEIENLINNRLRQKIGTKNINGDPIVLPLTTFTDPKVDEELKSIASDMVEGKIRLKNSEKSLLWDTSVKNLTDYLESRFGWTRDVLYTPTLTLETNPNQVAVGETITITGSGWKRNTGIKLIMGNREFDPEAGIEHVDSNGNTLFEIPDNAIMVNDNDEFVDSEGNVLAIDSITKVTFRDTLTDNFGAFSYTFIVPQSQLGLQKILVRDGFRGKEVNFYVTRS